MFRYFLLLTTTIIGALVIVNPASAAGPCASRNIRWAGSSNRIYIRGDVECTLTEIKALGSKLIPLELIDAEGRVWFLGANTFIQDGAKLILHSTSVGGDVNELRLKSNNTTTPNSFVKIMAQWGMIDINGVKITSWDDNVGGPDTEYATYKRAYIHVRSYLDADGVTPRESRMDIRNSDLGYLGYSGSETYGLSWKVLGKESIGLGVFDVVGVYGDIVNTKIHNNYFGVYTYGAQTMTFLDNEVYDNILYGIDPHDDSDHLLIDSNYVHHNGAHGIICSQRCNDLTITKNKSSNNGGNGIMLHRNTNHSLVDGNELYNNVDSGIAIFDSHNNQISGNTTKFNKRGIRLSVGSSNNMIENNDFSENATHGIYFYKGSDIPTSGDGRPKLNTLRRNTVNANVNRGLSLRQADSNVFEDNDFAGNGSYVVYIEDSDANTFEGNTTLGNTLNYYFSKLDSLNTIKDSDSFALKIGDLTSTMNIIDSLNTIFINSKSLSTNTLPTHSSITLNKANAGSSVVSFSRLRFGATPSAENLLVRPVTWDTSSDFRKKWTAKNDSSGTITVSYAVGDLIAGSDYNIFVDGVLFSTLTANESGEISFDYEGIFSTLKTFEVKPSI